MKNDEEPVTDPGSTVDIDQHESSDSSFAISLGARASNIDQAAQTRVNDNGVSADSANDPFDTYESLQEGLVVLDRFEIRKKLGRGGFGTVFSAFDRKLDRTVAIKQTRMLKSFVAGRVRAEARKIASLNHPNIVQIYDLIDLSDSELLIIMEHLRGEPLSARLKRATLEIGEVVAMAIEMCEALIHAHERQLVHSDFKPANLYLCENGRVKLLDFGLAVAYFPDQQTRIGGTPGYMSPEQIRGESHLIDGRTDIWAFGVVLYEMLTGTRPFQSRTAEATTAQTLFKLAPPPRQINPDIDTELQRIVLKCLEPLITARYESVADLRDDLKHYMPEIPHESGSKARSVPPAKPASDYVPSSLRLSNRGLQPFTESDAEVYLSIIPGPRDRNGIPDSIRFWKRWVESNDPQTEHPVGVLYGPSGSGKTSYIRAGLFQQLPDDVCRVYAECQPGDLGGRLTRIIETRIEGSSSESGQSSLRDLLLRVRSGRSGSHRFRKILIVLDQFESWAQSATLEERLNLAEALRQCDGIQIRALIVARDDYWAGVKELLHWLEIPMREGRNIASVELLDTHQAEQILEMIGRESGTLPAEGEPLSKDQQQFVSQSVQELAVDEKIISVHLVIFAQMVKHTKWTPRALRESGGVAGACSFFFHELFEKSSGHSPEYQRIAPAVPTVLAKLTPRDTDTVNVVSEDTESLRGALKEVGQQHLLDDTLRILTEDLRLISIVGPDTEPSDNAAENWIRYRLSHDFLVDPVSAYLARTRTSNWRGRSMARLIEMSDLWSRRPNAAYLPSFLEYILLSFGTLLQPHGETESRFLRAAAKSHAGKISATAVAILAFLFMSIVAWNQWTIAKSERKDKLREKVVSLLTSRPEHVADKIDDLQEFGQAAQDEIDVWTESDDGNARLRANLLTQSMSGETFAAIAEQILDLDQELFEVVLEVAKKTPDAKTILGKLADQTIDDELEPEQKELAIRRSDRAAILLAYLGDEKAVLKRLAGTNVLKRDQTFLTETVSWKGTPDLWANLLQTAEIPDVRYHAGCVLGGYLPKQLQDVSSKIDFGRLINSPDTKTHSIARFVANHTGKNVESFPLQPPADADWRVGPYGVSMVRFEPKKFSYQPRKSNIKKEEYEKAELEVSQPFWAATTSLPEQAYRDFVAAMAEDGREVDLKRPLDKLLLPDYVINDPSTPIMMMSLDHAIRLCNWISRRENLKECYQPRDISNEPLIEGFIKPVAWSFDEDANGYRLPTSEEYLLTAECGYLHPNHVHAVTIADAGGYLATTPAYPRRTFTLIPNRNGVFQMDRFCGTWITPEQKFFFYSLQEFGPSASPIQEHRDSPISGIFLCLNVHEER